MESSTTVASSSSKTVVTRTEPREKDMLIMEARGTPTLFKAVRNAVTKVDLTMVLKSKSSMNLTVSSPGVGAEVEKVVEEAAVLS